MSEIILLPTSKNAGCKLTNLDRFYDNVGKVLEFKKTTTSSELRNWENEMDRVMQDTMRANKEVLKPSPIDRIFTKFFKPKTKPLDSPTFQRDLDHIRDINEVLRRTNLEAQARRAQREDNERKRAYLNSIYNNLPDDSDK